jgi:transposase
MIADVGYHDGVAGGRKPKLTLSTDERAKLESLTRSRTAPVREVQRAGILFRYGAGEAITDIQRALGVSRVTIYKCIDKALAMGIDAGLVDTYHRPRQAVITEEARAWVVSVACTKPKDLGYAAELWTRQALANHIRKQAIAEGHPSLERAAKATVHRILAEQTLQPHRITYYLEMREVLLVYQQVELANQQPPEDGSSRPVITVSVDEKPGVQALATTAPDLPPVAGKYPTTARDHEYRRMGTVSILAALDLHDGHVTARVERRHRSREFIRLLKDLDAHYPADSVIRILLDNHSAHISRETREYLATRPNRFIYVHTPKHGSWLNIVETLFGKMARTFLRHIRVRSIEELTQRILLGIAEINAAPVVHHWKKFDGLLAPAADST